MRHQDEGGPGLPAPDGPQEVWQSLHETEEQGGEMRLNTDQLCAKALFRERENVWGHWVATSTLLVGVAATGYLAVMTKQIWSRLGAAWMAAVIAVGFWGERSGSRRFHAGESCAQFMVQELEGSRRTLLGIQWGIVLLLPTLLLFWYGDEGALRAWSLRWESRSRCHFFFLTQRANQQHSFDSCLPRRGLSLFGTADPSDVRRWGLTPWAAVAIARLSPVNGRDTRSRLRNCAWKPQSRSSVPFLGRRNSLDVLPRQISTLEH
jgi:hypothetical protein